MYILSGAVAFAKTKISTSDILVHPAISRSAAKPFTNLSSLVQSRCSVLSTENYFSALGKGRFSAEMNCTPTTLGVEAVHGACEAMGIRPEEIGLLIGDCSTPRQTIPAESQRIAGALGLKIPTFDILAPVIAPLLHFDLLSRWKKDQLPQYIALLYSNTPTVEAIGEDRYVFGDGATALIVSRQTVRGLEVQNSIVRQVASTNAIFPAYIPESQESSPANKIFELSPAATEALQSISTNRKVCFASPSVATVAKVSALTPDSLLSGGVSESGFALSSSVAATLVEALSFGTEFAILANCGDSFGTATLRRVS